MICLYFAETVAPLFLDLVGHGCNALMVYVSQLSYILVLAGTLSWNFSTESNSRVLNAGLRDFQSLEYLRNPGSPSNLISYVDISNPTIMGFVQAGETSHNTIMVDAPDLPFIDSIETDTLRDVFRAPELDETFDDTARHLNKLCFQHTTIQRPIEASDR